MIARLRFSIAAKLYVIFAVMAVATLALATFALINSQRNAATTAELESAYIGTQNVERVNGLIYAVVMESRGIYMSPDIATAKKFATPLLKYNDQIAEVVTEWKRVVRSDDSDLFKQFAGRIETFRNFRRELVRLGTEVSPAEGRSFGDNDANRTVRGALNKDLDSLAKLYRERAKKLHGELENNWRATVLVLTILASFALLLAVAGKMIIWRSVARPLALITRVTAAVASGERGVVIPFNTRYDEIGALARSIKIFGEAMDRNAELTADVAAEADTRVKREQYMADEIRRFSAEIEAALADFGRIAEQMVGASTELSNAAEQASTRTRGAASASAQASNSVRDIAMATEELSASVAEIDRQVAQSKAIAEQAIDEASRTDTEIKALNEAAKRIGDVVQLITAIAEQTNLLALNATIEAARAGDAGRGFAVVASEVKALAGQTAKATDEISTQIAGMQQATVRSVDAITAIQRTIGEIGSITSTIAAAVTEQGAATQEIARSAEIASRNAAETAQEVDRVNEATANTGTNVSTVSGVADSLGSVSKRIRSQVDGFFEKLRAA
ncbi:MAG TPA: methyl-accepting chemotaxis protein [Xanthobacteraceae bacterium]|jgi:methyl-accepting chemotaxis protein|nr:methyl-accepting chemotaxis protein [Xanthobacteraceae bacterium]